MVHSCAVFSTGSDACMACVHPHSITHNSFTDLYILFIPDLSLKTLHFCLFQNVLTWNHTAHGLFKLSSSAQEYILKVASCHVAQ